jgi:hypothetical protein
MPKEFNTIVELLLWEPTELHPSFFHHASREIPFTYQVEDSRYVSFTNIETLNITRYKISS